MKALMARLIAYLIAGAIIVGLVVHIFGRLDAYFGAEDRAITEASQAQLALHPALVRMRQKYLAVERMNAQLATRLGIWTDSARRLAIAHDSADSVTRVAAGQPIPQPSAWRAIADSERAGRAACSLALLACQRRAASAEAEADSLHRRLTAQVKVKDHPCGIWTGAGGGTAGKPEIVLGVGCRLLRSPWP